MIKLSGSHYIRFKLTLRIIISHFFFSFQVFRSLLPSVEPVRQRCPEQDRDRPLALFHYRTTGKVQTIINWECHLKLDIANLRIASLALYLTLYLTEPIVLEDLKHNSYPKVTDLTGHPVLSTNKGLHPQTPAPIPPEIPFSNNLFWGVHQCFLKNGSGGSPVRLWAN